MARRGLAGANPRPVAGRLDIYSVTKILSVVSAFTVTITIRAFGSHASSITGRILCVLAYDPAAKNPVPAAFYG